MSDRELSPEEIKFIEDNYLKAFDIFIKSQPLARAGSKNFFVCADYLKGENIDPSLWDFHVFLTALTMIAAEGKLDRDLTPAERADKERRVNRERELRDRRDGNVGTHRGHTLVKDGEAALDSLEAGEALKDEIRTLVETAKKLHEAEELNEQEKANIGPGDALIALQKILDPVGVGTATRETQRQITRWIRASDTKHYRSIRQMRPELATKMDRILARQIIED